MATRHFHVMHIQYDLCLYTVPAVLYVVKLCAFLSTFSIVCEELTALRIVSEQLLWCLTGDYLYVLLTEMSAVDCVTAV